MSATPKGSTPGPISHTGSFRSITAPRNSTEVNDEQRNGSLSTLDSNTPSVEDKVPNKAWMEKDHVARQDFPTDLESVATKDEQSTTLAPTQEVLSRAQSSQWQVAPAPSIPSADGDATYPEGGLRAWLVVLGSFCGMTACFGFMNTSKFICGSPKCQNLSS